MARNPLEPHHSKDKGQVAIGNLVGALHRNPLANSLVKNLGINRLLDSYMTRFPLRRKTAKGHSYQVASIPALVVAEEMFKTDLYARAIAVAQPETFIDIGANVGYFPVLVTDVTGNSNVEGFVVEPNPELQSSIRFHLEQNFISRVRVLVGAAGGKGSTGQTKFFLNPSHIASSLNAKWNPFVPLGGKVREISVEILDLEKEWRNAFPARRIGLLKIDIEGDEKSFLQNNSGLLKMTDFVLIEWHKWVTSLEEVSALLGPLGFELQFIATEDMHSGTAFFKGH